MCENIFADSSDNSLWINFGGISYHSDRSAGFNERNGGIGLEYQVTDKNSFALGEYKNSIRRQTNYALGFYTPYIYKDEMIKLGLLYGIATGYDTHLYDGLTGVVAPVIVVERGTFGLDIFVLPPVGEISSVVALTIKFKLK